jgi:hypothetical protein
MQGPYRRKGQPDHTIFMSKPFTDTSRDVELRLPGGRFVMVSAATLNHEYGGQQAAYAAQAHVDANGVRRGPTGRRRDSNCIRKVDVAHLITAPGHQVRLAA